MALVLIVCFALAGRAGGDPAVNPHWDARGCGACHRLDGGAAAPIEPAEVDRTCLRCHDGRAASAEPHPVGRFVRAGGVPPGWPLDEGRLSCVTCHDVRQACAADAVRTAANAKLLRIVGTGPGTGRNGFCGNCHAPADYPRFNPHLMLTAERTVIEGRCLACHTEVPDRGTTARTGRGALRGGGAELAVCRSCHAKHKDQFNPGHLGAKVGPEMQAFIRAREAVGLAAPPGAELVAQIKAAGAKPTLMPLAADGAITCSTCHNPHQAGVFRPGTALAYRPMRVVGDRAVSPVRGDQWCNHCHDL